MSRVCCAVVGLGLVACSAMGQEGVDRTRRPRVVSVEPGIGEVDVDPNLKVIRVRFDMPMSNDGYSFMGGGPSFPQPTEAARWVDAYTCELPVKLKANWDYQFGVNGKKHANFRSIWLVPAEPTVCRFTTGGVGTIKRSEKDQRASNLKSFEELCDAMRTRYSYLETRGVDWEAAFAEHRRNVVGAEDVSAWATSAARMLGVANDLHLWLSLDGRNYPTSSRSVRPNVARSGVASVIGELRRRSPHVWTGTTEDGIGYVAIDTWSSEAAAEIRRVHDYLHEMSSMRGMVIDVRANSGGSETLAKEIAGWFVKKRRVYAKHAYRRGGGPNDFTPVRERVVEPNDAPRRFAGPVAVLMGPVNMSSCEAFLLMMRQVENAKLVGSRSFGSSGNPKSTFLSNGIVAHIPTWKAMTPDGETFEGKGIEPDLVISSKGVDFARSDPVLAAALRWLRDS